MTEFANPLAWPDGWPRTPPTRLKDGRQHFGRVENNGRSSSKRALTFAEARDSLIDAARKAGASQLVISDNHVLTQRGALAQNRARPIDEGVAIYFQRGGVRMVMARDAFYRAEENMRSLALALEAMAQLERHGGSGLAGRAFQGFVALPAPPKPHEILGIAAGASEAEIRAAWRRGIGQAHPDQGGTQAAAAEINAARDAMLKALPK